MDANDERGGITGRTTKQDLHWLFEIGLGVLAKLPIVLLPSRHVAA